MYSKNMVVCSILGQYLVNTILLYMEILICPKLLVKNIEKMVSGRATNYTYHMTPIPG